jgi:hypothetical protein
MESLYEILIGVISSGITGCAASIITVLLKMSKYQQKVDDLKERSLKKYSIIQFENFSYTLSYSFAYWPFALLYL